MLLQNEIEITDVISCDVTFKEMTKTEILNYIKTKEPMDKAGAYAIQSSFAKFIDEIEGNYMSVMFPCK